MLKTLNDKHIDNYVIEVLLLSEIVFINDMLVTYIDIGWFDTLHNQATKPYFSINFLELDSHFFVLHFYLVIKKPVKKRELSITLCFGSFDGALKQNMSCHSLIFLTSVSLCNSGPYPSRYKTGGQRGSDRQASKALFSLSLFFFFSISFISISSDRTWNRIQEKGFCGMRRH